MINILFLGGSKKISLAEYFMKAGKSLKREVRIFSYELESLEPICLVGRTVAGLRWDEMGIKKHIAYTIRRHKINIVIPFVDQATILCCILKNEYKNVFFPVSSFATCQIMVDKIKADKWLKKHGFRVPPTSANPPLIAKPRIGSGGKKNIILKNQDDITFFKQNYHRQEYLVQQHIDAIEYSVDCYVSQGHEIISIVPRKRLEVINGEVSRSITEKDPKIIDLARKIINDACLKGLLTIQFLKEKKTNHIYVMEINTRIGSGVVTSIAAGADVAKFIISDYLKIPNVTSSNWKDNLLMTRAFQEVYFYKNKLLK